MNCDELLGTRGRARILRYYYVYTMCILCVHYVRAMCILCVYYVFSDLEAEILEDLLRKRLGHPTKHKVTVDVLETLRWKK